MKKRCGQQKANNSRPEPSGLWRTKVHSRADESWPLSSKASQAVPQLRPHSQAATTNDPDRYDFGASDICCRRECASWQNNRWRRCCWNWLSELSASAYHFDVLLGERHPLLAAE